MLNVAGDHLFGEVEGPGLSPLLEQTALLARSPSTNIQYATLDKRAIATLSTSRDYSATSSFSLVARSVLNIPGPSNQSLRSLIALFVVS